MNINVISIRRIEGVTSLKAFVDIRIDKSIVIRHCSVMEGKNGLVALLPRRVSQDGEWHEIVIVLDESLKMRIHKAILSAFKKKLSNGR